MISKGTKLYVCMLSYVPCQVITYLSVTQNLFCHELFICYTRYSVTYYYTCYTLQVCHVKLSMPSVTCISCHVIFIVTCYATLRNVVSYMVCHVTKCCMLHVWHVMKCSLLHLCLEVCNVCRLTFMSRYATSGLLSFMSRSCYVTLRNVMYTS